MTFLKGIYHFVLAWAGNIVYGLPSRKIFVLGVTGTKGKTTCIEVIDAVFTTAGKKTAVLSSLKMKVGDVTRENPKATTMPGRFFLKKFLRNAVRAGCDYALIEVTSEGVMQYRHRFIQWDAGIFLNLQPEHIESHGSFENYRAAKVQFFADAARRSHKKNKAFFVNSSDPSYDYFEKAVKDYGTVVLFQPAQGGVSGWLNTEFNLVHAAAARSFALSQGIDGELITTALNSFPGIPGRMEEIQHEPFRVVVDYAHTPDSLKAAYYALRADEGNLICVLGSCGGGRDKWKRPEMGRVASEYCAQIILTNEDPYDEKPEQIITDIKAGVLHDIQGVTQIVLDRREAIRVALSLAQQGDTVVMTGKGSERWIHWDRGTKTRWSERGVVEELLREVR
jgi:UDP-N-acetylmuramoyl-L-alanyl-D-glutamate--2,6-diaminopimelate ligase